jgi:hypothetical protein
MTAGFDLQHYSPVPAFFRLALGPLLKAMIRPIANHPGSTSRRSAFSFGFSAASAVSGR